MRSSVSYIGPAAMLLVAVVIAAITLSLPSGEASSGAGAGAEAPLRTSVASGQSFRLTPGMPHPENNPPLVLDATLYYTGSQLLLQVISIEASSLEVPDGPSVAVPHMERNVYTVSQLGEDTDSHDIKMTQLNGKKRTATIRLLGGGTWGEPGREPTLSVEFRESD